jgi:L-lactate dehydrogenase
MCRASQTRPGFDHVELPGAGALARREAQLREGVTLSHGIVRGLAESAARLGLTMPKIVS